jgi:hypothetical protein
MRKVGGERSLGRSGRPEFSMRKVSGKTYEKKIGSVVSKLFLASPVFTVLKGDSGFRLDLWRLIS